MKFRLWGWCCLGLTLIVGLWPGLALAGPADPIRLGVPTTLSIFQGDEMLKAVTMAVEEINTAGGVQVGPDKRKIELFSADIRDGLAGVPVQEALMGLEKMILDQKVDALVVGPIRSEALLPAMDIVAKYKVPFIGTVAMTPASEEKIRKDPEKYKYVFRGALNAKYLVGYALGAIRHLEKSFGFKKLFIIIQDVMWARGTAQAVSGQLEKTGWQILGTEAFPTGASDFSSALLKAQASGAQVIFTLFDMPTSGILVKQWTSMKVPAVLLGNISPMCGPDAWNTYDQKIAGAIMSIMEAGNISIPKIPAAAKFFQDYEKRWGKQIQAPHGPSASYNAVYILAEAMTRAGTTEPGAVAEAIKKMDYRGVIGRVRFDEGNQVIFGNDPQETAVGCMFQWRENGQRTVIFPESVAEDQVVLPSWMK